MLIAFKVALVMLFTDFVSGLIHWLEDVYAKPGMLFISKIAEENELHHTRPREFLKKNWWQSSWDIVLAVLILIVTTWWFKALTWEIVLFSILITNANQIHKWAHKTKTENNMVVTFLQKIHVLQSVKHHGKHHSGEKNSHYCVMTPFVNPVLERINFWRGLERLNSKVFSFFKGGAA